MKRLVPIFVVCASLFVTGPARADAEPLDYRPGVDLPLTLGLGAAWIGTELAKDSLAPDTCRWCNPPGLDARFRSSVVWNDTEAAAGTSDLIGFVALPVLAFGADTLLAANEGDARTAGVDALIVVEAVTLSSALTQLTKYSTGRERPFVHQLPAAEKSQTKHPADNNVSFFSGHTSLAFSLAVSASTVATLRGYDYAWATWATLVPLAATVGYLRMGGDRHYLTDVVAGALVGGGVGFLVPWLHQPRNTDAASAVDLGVGIAAPQVAVTIRF